MQDLITALGLPQSTPAQASQAQQALQNVITSIGGAQTSVLSAQGRWAAIWAEIQSVQTQTSAQHDALRDFNLQSANHGGVANYSEAVTSLQAAQLSFAKVQNLTLFQYLRA